MVILQIKDFADIYFDFTYAKVFTWLVTRHPPRAESRKISPLQTNETFWISGIHFR